MASALCRAHSLRLGVEASVTGSGTLSGIATGAVSATVECVVSGVAAISISVGLVCVRTGALKTLLPVIALPILLPNDPKAPRC
jgi:hypothetical protein